MCDWRGFSTICEDVEGWKLDVLGEYHRLLRLFCEHNEREKHDDISLADLFRPFSKREIYFLGAQKGKETRTEETISFVVSVLLVKYPAYPPAAPSASFFNASTCSVIAFWNNGHICSRIPKSAVSSGGQFRFWTSDMISSVRRIMVSSGMTGGTGSRAVWMNFWSNKQ